MGSILEPIKCGFSLLPINKKTIVFVQNSKARKKFLMSYIGKGSSEQFLATKMNFTVKFAVHVQKHS